MRPIKFHKLVRPILSLLCSFFPEQVHPKANLKYRQSLSSSSLSFVYERYSVHISLQQESKINCASFLTLAENIYIITFRLE